MKRSSQIAILKLTDSEKIQIIKDYEQLERDGFIDDCLLRSVTENFCNENVGMNFSAMWMNIIANEAYRYFANKWLGKSNEATE